MDSDRCPLDGRIPTIMISKEVLAKDCASRSRLAEIQNPASARPSRLKPEGRPEAPGRREAPHYYLYDKFSLGAEHPRAAGPKSKIQLPTDPAG